MTSLDSKEYRAYLESLDPKDSGDRELLEYELVDCQKEGDAGAVDFISGRLGRRTNAD